MTETVASSPLRAVIAGNWKMNMKGADTDALAEALASYALSDKARDVDMLICPPALWIERAIAAVNKGSDGKEAALGVGAQDCHIALSGAHTGDIAAEMFADAGCRAVIVGHSERRADHGETDALVKGKAQAVQNAGMIAIVCVGETLEERDAGQAEAVVGRQIAGSVPTESNAANLIVAYEPVWAIGTGRTPTLEDIEAMHRHMRGCLGNMLSDAAGVRLLYGGSVKPSNAAEILSRPDVNGALVGGASLKAADFQAIVEGATAGA